MNDDSMPLCFVIMPFKKEFDPIYDEIKRIAENEGFHCIRADEITKGIISEDIFDNIFNSSVIIADLTEKNPNVFYELALAHLASKNVIMISQDRDIPFHISPGYVVLYENTIRGSQILDRELRRLLRHVLNGGTIKNPLKMFLGPE